MNITIDIVRLSTLTFTFNVRFSNDENEEIAFPIERIKNVAERVGIILKPENKNGALEPIEFEIVNATNPETMKLLMPGDSCTISLDAKLNKIGKVAWGLKFKNATYKVEPNVKYEVGFSFENFKSDWVGWSFTEE